MIAAPLVACSCQFCYANHGYMMVECSRDIMTVIFEDRLTAERLAVSRGGAVQEVYAL